MHMQDRSHYNITFLLLKYPRLKYLMPRYLQVGENKHLSCYIVVMENSCDTYPLSTNQPYVPNTYVYNVYMSVLSLLVCFQRSLCSF